jgi:hypothetical protein
MKIKLLLIGFITAIACIHSYGQKKILITDFGCLPGDHNNMTLKLSEALKSCESSDSSILIFPKGQYNFWPDSSRNLTIGIQMRNLKNVTIDGEGSDFIFHGNIQVAEVSNCENIILRNLNVDWEHPFIYQGKYVTISDEYIELEFKRGEYPYVIENDHFYMTGEGWKVQPNTVYCNLFDKNTREILYKTHDGNNSQLFLNKATEIKPGIVRFYGKPNTKPEPGTITTLFAGRYIKPGFEISESKNVTLRDLNIYHALSQGVLGIRSENISLDNVNITINQKKNRVFSTIADATHFVNCKGYLRIINCEHTGQGDDFINIHGAYSAVSQIISTNSVIVTKNAEYMKTGDEIWWVDPVTCQRSDVLRIQQMELLKKNGHITGSFLTFAQTIPKQAKVGDFIENKTWNATVEIKGCRILKNNRARGILITTPCKAVIENNYFRTAGTAILIEGDMNFWFESGGVRGLQIKNNVFDDCLTSGCESGRRGEWGEAIITITPSHHPKGDMEIAYHKNIIIENNIFKTFDIPLINARSVDSLSFSNNRIIVTKSYIPYAWQKSSFLLEGCRNVFVSDNLIDENYTTRTIKTRHMKEADLRADLKENFIIIQADNKPTDSYIDDFINPGSL